MSKASSHTPSGVTLPQFTERDLERPRDFILKMNEMVRQLSRSEKRLVDITDVIIDSAADMDIPTYVAIDKRWRNKTVSAILLNAAVSIFTNAQSLDEDTTISGDRNAFVAGPYTINSGVTLTIASGARMIIL